MNISFGFPETKAEMASKKDEYDHCVLCGVETPYKRSTHIDMRTGYVEGAGQLCKNCYEKDTIPTIMENRRTLITISAEDILRTPNDMELGSLVRQRYYEYKDNI